MERKERKETTNEKKKGKDYNTTHHTTNKTQNTNTLTPHSTLTLYTIRTH